MRSNLSKIISGPDADIQVGNALPLEMIPLGTHVHNIELRAGKGAKMVRAAGAGRGLSRMGEGFKRLGGKERRSLDPLIGGVKSRAVSAHEPRDGRARDVSPKLKLEAAQHRVV